MNSAWEVSESYRHKCSDCGRFVSLARRHGWEACGEFGEETRYVCATCLDKGVKLQAGNGSSDPRWCGVHLPLNTDEREAP